MSGGQHEAQALEDDYNRVVLAADELVEALKCARAGFRGVRVAEATLLNIINTQLKPIGLRVVNDV